ncbi:MAG TPA: hypothetical protein PKW30_04765 [Campylobacterales bacterium]|nr:hypothetical protein [Campylobacterales bacterium]
MKKGLEELKNLDPEVVVSKAHIVQTTLEDIVNKRFDRLNHVKAKGLIKILEREFDLDLSEWTREFEAFHSIKEPEVPTIDKLNAEAAKNDKKPTSKIALIALAAAIAIGGGYMLYVQSNSVSPETNGSTGLQNEINETNASISFNVAFDQNTTDQNTTDKNVTDKNITAPSADKNITAAHPNAPLGAQGSFFVEPTKKVWLGIRYLDTATNRWFETVAEHKFDFNGSREQLIAFGHSQIKVVAGGSTIESKAGGKVRYHYKNGKLREISEEEYNKLAGKTDAKKEANATKPKQ